MTRRTYKAGFIEEASHPGQLRGYRIDQTPGTHPNASYHAGKILIYDTDNALRDRILAFLNEEPAVLAPNAMRLAVHRAVDGVFASTEAAGAGAILDPVPESPDLATQLSDARSTVLSLAKQLGDRGDVVRELRRDLAGAIAERDHLRAVAPILKIEVEKLAERIAALERHEV